MVDGARLPSPRAALTALWDWDGAALSGHHCVPLALRAVTCDQQCADSRRWGLGLCAPASEGMRKTRNTPGSTHQSPDRYPIDGPRANRAQGTRRAADERVATILLAPNFVRPTGSVENLPEQPTRDTRETAKRAKRSLEEGGATRKVRGAEKEYTGEYYRDRRTVSVHAWRGAIDACGIRRLVFTSILISHLEQVWMPPLPRPNPSILCAMDLHAQDTDDSHRCHTGVRSSLLSRPFSSPLHTWPWITIGESFYVSSTVLTCSDRRSWPSPACVHSVAVSASSYFRRPPPSPPSSSLCSSSPSSSPPSSSPLPLSPPPTLPLPLGQVLQPLQSTHFAHWKQDLWEHCHSPSFA